MEVIMKLLILAAVLASSQAFILFNLADEEWNLYKEQLCRFSRENVGATDSGFVRIPMGDEEALKAAVATKGPISVAIDASSPGFQMYREGVYYEHYCGDYGLDHGVLVVGYGTTPDGVDYWLVKNSWGTTWGLDGYIKMARNRDNNCGIASKALYPLV